MSRLLIINKPPHYISGRTVEPIEVIESWGLCHHMACVVKYITRYGRKENSYYDLLKAEWYLKREIERYEGDYSKCQHFETNDMFLDPLEIFKDWQLTENLEEVLYLIADAKMKGMPQQTLKEALKHLQSQIFAHERNEGMI